MDQLRRSFTLKLSLNLLWPLIALAGAAISASLSVQPPHDLWWHLKIGELIHETGAIPSSNFFGWTLPADYPFTYGAWLGEYLLYRLHDWGGVSLLLFARTAMVTAAFALVGWEARRRSGFWRLAALAVGLLGVMSLNNLIVRPQNWSWVPFALYLVLLGRYAAGALGGRWLWLLPALMLFWVNAHGAYVLGLVLVGVFTAGEGLRALLRWPEALPWRKVAHLALVSAVTLAATLANPQFFRIYAYVLDLMTDAPSQGLVVEWQSPTPTGIPNTTFFVAVLALLLVWAYARKRPTPTEALLVTGFLWLAWSGQRYVIWFGMAAMPLFAEGVAELLPRRYLHAPAPRNVLNLILALLLWLPVLLVQPWFVEGLPLPESYWDLVWRDVEPGPLLATSTPVAAADYLREHPGGRLFNDMGYGSYLIWALPEQGVFVDARVELYPYEQWQDYVRIGNGVRYNELLAEYGADRILLSLEGQKRLAGELRDDPLWCQEYGDEYAELWALCPR